MNSYKEERRLIELASDKKKSAEEIAHLMGRPPNTIRRRAVRLGISLRKSKPKSSPNGRSRSGATLRTSARFEGTKWVNRHSSLVNARSPGRDTRQTKWLQPPSAGAVPLRRPGARRSPERHTSGPTNRWPERYGQLIVRRPSWQKFCFLHTMKFGQQPK
jgi:hypothetical protein